MECYQSLNGVWDFYPDYDDRSKTMYHENGDCCHSLAIGGNRLPDTISSVKTVFDLKECSEIKYTKLRIQIHAGSKLEKIPREKDLLLMARINDGRWMSVRLEPYLDDGTHWVDVPVNPDDLAAGSNTVVITSTAQSKGSLTQTSLDIFASTSIESQECSYFFDRDNWAALKGKACNVRLWYASTDGAGWQDIPVPSVWEGRFEGKMGQNSGNGENAELRTRVNSGKWEPLSLIPFKDDGIYWLETPVDPSLLKPGDNEIVVDSTIANYGNNTRESLDLFGSSNKPTGRSYFSNNLESWFELPDRNWNIRLKIRRKGESDWETIGYDEGLKSFNTVIGAYVPNGSHFYMKSILSLDNPEGVEEASVIALVHVGSAIETPVTDVENTYKYDGVGWYRRYFKTPACKEEDFLRLCFKAADYFAEAWVNRVYVGSHEGGYTSFKLDLPANGILLGGQDENELVVRVVDQYDPRFGGRHNEFPIKETLAGFLQDSQGINYAGLWRDVGIEVTGSIFVEEVFILPDIDRSLITARIDIRNRGFESAQCKLVIRVCPQNGEGSLGEGIAEVAVVDMPKSLNVEMDVYIPDMKLWSVHDPFLYKAEITLIHENRIISIKDVNFGMRKVEARGSKIYFNNKPILLTGVLHWGLYWASVAERPEVEQVRKEVRDLKAAGFNAIKFTLFVPPEYVFDEFDKMGMYAYVEYPVWNPVETPDFFRRARRHIKEMLLKDRNHPCLIMSDFNCEMHKFSEQMDILMRDTVAMGKRLAPNRLYLDNSGNGVTRYGDFYACHPYNEFNKFKEVIEAWASLRAESGDKPLVLGEYADADTVRDTAAIREANGGVLPWWWSLFHVKDPEEILQSYGYSQQQVNIFKIASRQRAFAARKHYLEASRLSDRVVAMFVTHLNDIPATQAGLYDDNFMPKFNFSEFQRFTKESAILLDSKTRNFWCGSEVTVTPYVSHYGTSDFKNVRLVWKLYSGKLLLLAGVCAENVAIPGERVSRYEEVSFVMPETISPSKLGLVFEVTACGGEVLLCNDWWLWAYPKRLLERKEIAGKSVGVFDPDSALDIESSYPWIHRWDKKWVDLLITTVWNSETAEYLAQGGKIIYAGEKGGNFEVRQGGFNMQAMPVVPGRHPALGDFPHEGFGDQQFLELAVPYYLISDDASDLEENIIARLELRNYEIGSYLALKKTGKGGILQTTLRLGSKPVMFDSNIRNANAIHHEGHENVAGNYLLDHMMRFMLDTL